MTNIMPWYLFSGCHSHQKEEKNLAKNWDLEKNKLGLLTITNERLDNSSLGTLTEPAVVFDLSSMGCPITYTIVLIFSFSWYLALLAAFFAGCL